MATTIQDSTLINCPVEKIFSYTTEAKNWPVWQSFIMEAEQTSQGPWCIGATFKGVSRLMGISMKWTGKASEYEPNKMWSKDISCGSMFIHENAEYVPLKEGIEFSISYEMKIGGFLKLFSPMIVASMRRETKKSLNKLKNIIEKTDG